MFCSLTKSSILVSLLKAAWTSQPAEHKTHRRQLDAIWQEKVYNRSQAAWPRKDKTSPGIRRSLLFYCWKLEFSFHMEMVVLVLWTDFSLLSFLATSSFSCSVSSLFLYQCRRTVSRSSGNIHPPSSLSNSLSIYSRQKGAGGCLTSLFFWTEVVGNFQIRHHYRGKS